MAVPSGAVLREPESGRRFRIDGMGVARCRQALAALLDRYRRRFHSMGVDYALLATGDPFDRAMGAFLASRRWHRRGGRPAASKRRRA
jgi:hypothetical protein